MSRTHKHITEEAAHYGNVADSLDYELRGKRKTTWDGRWIMAHREMVIRATMSSILGGTLRPGKYRTKTIHERGKTRVLQSISLLRSIGIHAVMKVVESRMDKTFISDTAASIKGRGSHYLLKRMTRDMIRDKEGTRYTYKDDIRKFYQNTSQDYLMSVVRDTFRDRRLVRILERWVRMLPTGVSIGMRPSQGLENLLLSVVSDHVMKDKEGARNYRRYCDDRVIQDRSLYRLTGHILTLRQATSDAGLDIKPSAQLWPTAKRGIDFLGYVVSAEGKISVRKSTKQRFSRRWKRVTSRRRRRELAGSFYGICRHGHCRHLFRTLTGLTMTQFSELGFVYQLDGKKEFDAESIKLSRLSNKAVTVKDFETDIKTREGDGRYVVLVECEGRQYKFFTNSRKMKAALDFVREKNALPFECIIEPIGGNSGYMFR